jgi:energy-coupling factor transporter ATP-binding protein EcfA2
VDNHKPLRLGDILLMRGLVDADGLEAAFRRQREKGGRLGESLVALSLLSPRQLMTVLDETPAMPLNIQETGIGRSSLLALLLKFMRMESCQTLPEFSNRMKLPFAVLQELIDEASRQRLLEVVGSVQRDNVCFIRHSLTDRGLAAAADALAQSQYLGPAPVPLVAFQQQVKKQTITNENLQENTLRESLAGLMVRPKYVRRLLPALRAGRTVLLYGPPGNGKTSICTRLATLFRDVVYIPYAIEVHGQIVKMYDSGLHKLYDSGAMTPPPAAGNVLRVDTFDARWVACHRPVVVAGGELTLEMLDLRFEPSTKFYEAPLHMKAMNGVFLIDDFGRQRVNPAELLNRWIVPLESRIDYLTLNTGMSFLIPFDELVFFSTNLRPSDLMDAAFLRRIPYKIELVGPTIDEYKELFFAAAERRGLAMTMEIYDYIVQRLLGTRYELAYFQPDFLCEQVWQICNCFALPLCITYGLADEALGNLYVDLTVRRKTDSIILGRSGNCSASE